MKFNIYASTTVSVSLGEFEADDIGAAIDMAWDVFDEKDTTLCHQCARDMDFGEFDIGGNKFDVEEINE